MSDHMPDDVTPTEADLARLADGTLPEAEREALRGRAEASPELAAALQEQTRAVSLMRSLDAVAAPSSLRASLNEMTAEAAGRPPGGHRIALPRWRRRLFLPAATALAIVVAAIVVLAGGTETTTVSETARLALAHATMAAPPPDPRDGRVLKLRAASIPFPAYSGSWEVTGARRDVLHGRTVTTVYYRAGDGTRVGYAIVSGNTLAYPTGPSRTVHGVRYVFSRVGSAKLVTWRRHGHTCVIAGQKVGDRTLLRLATADENTAA